MTIIVVILHRFSDFLIPSVPSPQKVSMLSLIRSYKLKMEGARGIGSGQFSGSGSNCPIFSAEKQKTWKFAIIIVSSAASVACILAIILILAFKGHKRFVHRLTLYLMVAALLEAVVSVLDVMSVYHNGTVVAVREGLEDFCAASGFLLEVTVWISRLVMCWIVFYLVMVLVFKHNTNAIKWKHEVCGLAVVLILPLLITWVPFVKGMYGLSQAHCWIKISESDCTYDYVGLTFMFVFDYGPELLVVLATFISLGTILIVMCRRAVRLEQGFYRPSVHQKGLKEVLLLLFYPLIYFVLWTAIVTTRIYDVVVSVRVQESNSRLPWLVYSIAVYLARLFIPLTCLLHLSILCCRKRKTRQHVLTTTTSYDVPNEFTDQEDEPLVIRGQRTKILSKGYKSVFEGSIQNA